MSIEISEKELSFKFEFDAIKFDDSQFYREHFSRIKNGIKAIDILAIKGNIGYLIEIKDYTHPDTRDKDLSELIEEVLTKIISTLAAILPMKNNVTSPIAEKDIADLFSKTDEIKIFLHLELPPPTSRLIQATWTFQNIEMQLTRKLNSIDAEPKVVSKDYPNRFPWVVTTSQ